MKEFITTRIKQLDKPALMNYDSEMTSIDATIALSQTAIHPTVKNGVIALDENTEFKVYSIDGVMVHSGTNATAPLNHGVYVW